MKNTELLEAIGSVDERWLQDVEQAMTVGTAPRRRTKKTGRALLLAAALTALLGVTAYASAWFGLSARLIETENPYRTEETEPLSGGWLATNGEADSPEARSSLEWEGIVRAAMQAGQDWDAVDAWAEAHPEYRMEHEVYNCMNQEMVEQLHAIAEKYGLRLHSEVAYPTTQKLFEQATGVGDFLCNEGGSWQGHYIFEDGSFKGEGLLELEGGSLVYTLNRSKAGVLASYGMYVLDPEGYEEWQYEVDGHTLNLALRQNEYGPSGLIFFHEGETFVTIGFSARYIPGTPADFDRSDAETAAASFDYGVLCGGETNLAAINGRTAVEAKPKDGLMTMADFLKTPEYRAGSRFHSAYNEWYDSQQTDPSFVKGQYVQFFFAPFPTGIKALDETLDEILTDYALHVPTSAKAIIGGAWIDPARMTSLMSYRVLDPEHPYEEHLPEATEADIWALIGTDGFLLDEQSYIHTAVRWDTGAWQCKVVYGSSGCDLTYVPKGSFCPVLRELLHPDAEGWAYETACGEQVYMAPDGEMEYPRFQTPLALYETDTAYLLLSPDGANDAGTMQLFADSIDFTKFS